MINKEKYRVIVMKGLLSKINSISKTIEHISQMDEKERDTLSLESLLRLKSKLTDELVEFLIANNPELKAAA